MADLSLRYLKWYQYVLELFPLYIIVSFSYVGLSNWPPLSEFLIVAVIIAPIAGIFLHKIGGNMAVYAAIPIVLITGLWFGFDFIYALIIAIVTVVRIENRYIKPDQDVEEVTLMATFIMSIGAFTILYSTSEGFSVYFLILFIVQLFVWLGGRLIYYYLRDEQTVKNSISKKVYLILVSLGFLAVVSYVLYVIYPYIKYGLGYLFYWGLYAFAWLMSPIFNMLESLELDPPEIEGTDSEMEFGEDEFDQREPSTFASSLVEYINYFIVLLILVGILFAYLYYRNRLKMHQDNVRTSYDDVEKNQSEGRKFFKRQNKSTRPNHRVRKAYYDLEKWAAKQGVGRREYETIEEWIERLGVGAEVNQSMINIYKLVRYKEKLDLDYNEAEYLNAVKRLKEILKKKVRQQKSESEEE
ncbi:hypothetical protein [Alkalibacillus silvisoli]|uniref:DUF4129 domain-containing protein n=1 Tax=Alkalibacillus silvisoli TaxID=392823 RepID=A0ABP3JDY3_9BACI